MNTHAMTEAPATYGEANHQRLYEIIGRRDPSYNGKFFVGVLTTGIYCLPCCAARTPKPQNIRFFSSYADAEAAGLRPCKRCKPDRLLLYEEERQVVEAIERLRKNPDEVRRAEDLADLLGCGLTKLNALCHTYYHATPAHLIADARMSWARRQLQAGTEVGEVGLSCGFESLSGFYEQFRRFNGMAPGDYRDLRDGESFRITWPERFLRAPWLAYLGRDPESLCERLRSDGLELAANLNVPACLRLEFSDDAMTVRFAPEVDGFLAHQAIQRLLGLGQDLDGFRSLMGQSEEDIRLLPEGAVLRIPQTVSVWDGIVWAVLGQQVNVAFAARLRSRLAQLAGTQVAEGLWTVPTPAQMAELAPEDLTPLQFSSRKSEYLIGIAREVTEGRLRLERLDRGPATKSERKLLELKGIGPWAAHYILMRACGFMDATPLGDTGLTSALQLRFGGDRPEETRTKELMKRYAPYRSLATYHLWQSLKLGVG